MSKKRRHSSPARRISLQERARASQAKTLSKWLLIVFGLAGLGMAGLYIAIPSKTPPLIDHTNAQLVDMGRHLYATGCASCHGANLEGQENWAVRRPDGKLPAPPHDQSGHTWHHRDRVLFDITKRGPAAYPAGYATDMPAFGDRLSDQEIAAIVAYIKSTWPKDILERQQRSNLRAVQ
jgi:mono/diheme cytochrome c family protein